jgi:tetratricopeptide (TPR) repeat protein
MLLSLVVFVTACGPPGPRALLQGRKFLEAGQTEAAVKEFKSAVSFLPTNAAAWNYLGLAYHHAGQSTNAIEAYSRAIKLDRDLLEARLNLGCVLLEENRLEAAKVELTAYTLRRGGEPEGWLKLGAAHLRGREAGQAEKCFREVLRIETNRVEALNGLGLAQLQRGRSREAADLFAEALKVQPDYRPALLNLATVSQEKLNDRPEALRRYRQYLALQPRAADWDAVNAVVRALEQPVVTAQSARTLTNAAAGNAEPPVAVVTNQTRPSNQPLASLKPQPATKAASNTVLIKPVVAATNASSLSTALPPEVVKLPPGPAVTNPAIEPKPSSMKSNAIVQGTTQSVNASPPKAERRGFLSRLNPFTNGARSAPVSQVSTVTVASAGITSNSVAGGGGRSPSSPQTPPSGGNRREAEAALFQGQQAQRANREAEAFQFFRRAAQLDPAYFEAYYCLGLSAFRMRNFQASQNAWQSALTLRPDNGEARYNLALTLKAANQPRNAADELEKLLSLHPDEARAHLTLGNLYADQLRDIARARQHYQKVLQLDPRNPQAQAIRFWLVSNPG